MIGDREWRDLRGFDDADRDWPEDDDQQEEAA